MIFVGGSSGGTENLWGGGMCPQTPVATPLDVDPVTAARYVQLNFHENCITQLLYGTGFT